MNDFEIIDPKSSFPRWRLSLKHEWNETDSKFMEEYECIPTLNKMPEFNPFSEVFFDSSQKPKDIYSVHNVLHVYFGFLVSDKMLSILQEYMLDDYVLYSGIECVILGEIVKMNFIYFYNDSGVFLDVSKSTFAWIDQGVLEHTVHGVKGIIENNIRVKSIEEYDQLRRQREHPYLNLILTKAYCQGVWNYDVFLVKRGLLKRGVYFSRRLRARLSEEGIKGVDYKYNLFYTFVQGDE